MHQSNNNRLSSPLNNSISLPNSRQRCPIVSRNHDPRKRYVCQEWTRLRQKLDLRHMNQKSTLTFWRQPLKTHFLLLLLWKRQPGQSCLKALKKLEIKENQRNITTGLPKERGHHNLNIRLERNKDYKYRLAVPLAPQTLHLVVTRREGSQAQNEKTKRRMGESLHHELACLIRVQLVILSLSQKITISAEKAISQVLTTPALTKAILPNTHWNQLQQRRLFNPLKPTSVSRKIVQVNQNLCSIPDTRVWRKKNL